MVLGRPAISSIVSASVRMEISVSVPMLKIPPTACGLLPAAIVASMASETYVKQRVCEPSPMTVSGLFFRICPMKMVSTRPTSTLSRRGP